MASKQYKRKVGLCIMWARYVCSLCRETCRNDCDVKKFALTMQHCYGVEMQMYHIPLVDSQDALDNTVESFIQMYSDPDTLIIVYHVSHGRYNERLGLISSWDG